MSSYRERGGDAVEKKRRRVRGGDDGCSGWVTYCFISFTPGMVEEKVK